MLYETNDVEEAMRAHMQMEPSRIAMEEYDRNKEQIDRLNKALCVHVNEGNSTEIRLVHGVSQKLFLLS